MAMQHYAAEEVSIDLCDIMDVVTLYKCKLCDFSCNQPEGIGQHVQQTHTVSQVKQSRSESRQLAALSSSKGDQTDIHSDQKATISYDNGMQSSDASLQMECHSVNTSMGILGHEEMQTGQGDLDAVDRIINGVSLTPGQPGSHAAVTEGQAEEGIAINKEIYLCGQCNLGFDSIENCKSHMLRDHNICAEPDDEVAEDSIESHGLPKTSLPPKKVSVGTQVMTRKKPGRKRRVKEETGPQMSVEEACDEGMITEAKEAERAQESTSDEELALLGYKSVSNEDRLDIPYKGSDSMNEFTDKEDDTSIRRRRRRMPHRLTSLYYMGRQSPTRSTNKHPPPAKIKAEPRKLRCLKAGCTARFYKSTSMDLHLACHKTVQGSRREVFACPRCEVTEPCWKVLRHHLWKAHRIDTDLYACEKCDFRSDTLFRLERHVQIHSEDRPYLCDVCNKGFKQASQLHNHKGMHADKSEPNKWYSSKQCEICLRNFANLKSLKIHIETVHKKQRQFGCPYCNHTASRKAIMDLHVRTHTGEKPFKCDLCTYTTGDHNSLRRHKMRHTGEKPYKCRHCPYSAIQAISLKTHMKNKHPGYEGIYACNLCQYQTVNEQYYKQHVMDHENGLVPALRSPANAGDGTAAGGMVKQNSHQSVPSGVNYAPQRLVTLADGRQAVAIAGPGYTGPAVISSEDLIKLANIGTLQGGPDTAQLIYSALNALSKKQDKRQDGSESSGTLVAQPTVQSSTQDGVTTHTITFHIPPTEDSGQGPADRQQTQSENLEQTCKDGLVEVIKTDAQDDAQPQEQQYQQVIDNSASQVVYTTEALPENRQQAVSHEDSQVAQGQEEIILEVGPATDAVVETTVPDQVSTYTVAPMETITYEVESDEPCPLKIEDKTMEVVQADKVAEANAGEMSTMVMEVMDEEGNIQKTHVQYVTCTVDQN